jgi:mono/diheme cytochrome c family protein
MRPAVVTALAALVSAAGPAAAADLTGKEVFDRHCVHCHGAGDEMTGTQQLARTRGKDKALLTERDDLPPEYIRMIVRQGLKAMPAFVPSDLTDAQLQALADYLAN